MEGSRMNHGGVSRRAILKGGAAAALALSGSRLALGAASGQKIRLGMIGCGGRGTWIGQLFLAHGGYEIAAAADYFPAQAKAFGEKFGVAENRRFSSLSGYKALLELGDLDAVAIESPPYFHPEQACAAVDAGKHVYLAKPVAVDAPGVFAVREAAERARRKGLAFLIDFQTRANPFYIEAARRVRQGALGTIAFGEARYHADRLEAKAPDDGSPENRLRNWVFDIAYSGDILVEQNIHALDVMSWMMGDPPLSAVGAHGRKGRTDVGDCSDHFALLYRYADGVAIPFTSKQYNDGAQNGGIACDLYGNRGWLLTKYGGTVMIYGEAFYRGGDTGAIFKEGAQANIADFHRQIAQSAADYATVEPSVQSHLVALMGRLAAYKGGETTWKETLESGRMEADLSGLNA